MSGFRILDLSGFMFSGKGAVHDLVSEIDGFWTPGVRSEFDLLRVKDGVADLENAVSSWSPIRADAAARRYLGVVRRMAAVSSGLGRLFVPGFGYADRYPRFVELAERFIEEITVSKWSMYWPYHLLDQAPLAIALFKLRRRLFGLNENLGYRLVSGEKFFECLRDYLQQLLSGGVDSARYHSIVLNNAFEPFEPARFVNYFHDARCIVVDRDPRDVFVAGNRFQRGFNDQVELYRRISGAHDVGTFINRIRVYRRHISKVESPRVLRLQFEDLVQKYDETLARICAFLQVDPSSHVRKRQVFDPEKSRSEIGIWRDYPDRDAIRSIEKALLE